MEEQGYIALYRKLLDWDWYLDSNTKALFIHLLLKANYKDQKYQGELIKRGQHKTGLFKLCAETGLSIQQIRTALKKLESTNDITSKSTNKYRIITVTNYNEYQSVNKQNNKQVTNNQQTSNKQVTTNNKDNKEKNVNNVINKIYFDDSDINELFLEFLQIRKKLKAVNSERAINIQIGKLEDYDVNIQKQMLENAIANSWKSVYEIRDNGFTKPTEKYKPEWVDEIMDSFDDGGN